MRKATAALAIIVALTLAHMAPVSAGLAGTTHTNCGQSAYLGARVCFDKTGAYGLPTLVNYSGSTTVSSAAFGTLRVCTPGPSFIATPSDTYTNGESSYVSPVPHAGAYLGYGYFFFLVASSTRCIIGDTIANVTDAAALADAYTKIAAGRPLVVTG